MRKYHKEYEEQKKNKYGLWYQSTGAESLHFQKYNNSQKKNRTSKLLSINFLMDLFLLPKGVILSIFLLKQILLFQTNSFIWQIYFYFFKDAFKPFQSWHYLDA